MICSNRLNNNTLSANKQSRTPLRHQNFLYGSIKPRQSPKSMKRSTPAKPGSLSKFRPAAAKPGSPPNSSCGKIHRGRRARWLPHARLDLVEQTIKAFHEAGIAHVGVIQGKHYLTDPAAPVQICSEQTLTRREIPQFDHIFIDECHLQFKKILAWIDDPKLQSVPVIGLSATPWSKGLGKHYRQLINPTSIQNLIDKKILCPFTVFAPPGPDLSQVRTIAGDYHEGDLSLACDTKVLVANIVTTWQARGEDRPTILFAIDRKHAKHLEERFT
jgi:DNA repair protein RadD